MDLRELSKLRLALVSAVMGVRRLVDTRTGPLNYTQKLLLDGIMRDHRMLEEAFQAELSPRTPEPEAFDLALLVADLAQAFTFVARRKQIEIRLLTKGIAYDAYADREMARAALIEGVGAAVMGSTIREPVSIKLSRAPDRFTVTITASSWNPKLPPAPLPGSGVTMSLIKSAEGTSMVITIQRVP